MKKLGVIGGMGPMATQLFYKNTIEMTDANCDQEHIDMIILSHASMPDRTASIKSNQTDDVFNKLLNDAKMLEENGVCAIAIPCNTSHYFWEKLQKEIDTPIINMVRETVLSIKENNPTIKKIGLLATDGTVFSGIYNKECERVGIECVTPDEEIQKVVMDIIYNQIKKGENGNMEDFEKVDIFLKKSGCEAAILACTELSCFKDNHELTDFYVDAMQVLSKKAITMCGRKLR
ncbi:MAG: aspartate/glutamate racemase family protein [Clostridia bacterium]|nr:aspartate/glutamate racemase family protein [Clostridia bacterium]